MTGSPLLAVHLVFAGLATLTFWLAALARKGGPLHRRVGAWFARLVYLTAITGAVMATGRLTGLTAPPVAQTWSAAALDAERQTMWLVLYVLVTIVAPVQHGLAVVRAGAQPARLRSRLHSALALAGIAGSITLLPASLLWARWPFLLLAPVGLIVGLRNIAYANRATATRLDWEREHLTSLLSAGATLHTALLVFGSSRSLGLQMTGISGLVPWTLPAVLGLAAIVWLRSTRR